MKPVEVTAANFEQEVLKSDKPVLVDFWASWCGPCRMMAPIVEEIAETHPELHVCKVNTDDSQELAEKFRHDHRLPAGGRCPGHVQVTKQTKGTAAQPLRFLFYVLIQRASRCSFSRSVMVTVPRPERTMPASEKYFSRRLTTSRALPM